METQKINVRGLYFEDTFTLSEIIEKMNLQADLNYLFDEAKKRPDAQSYLGGQMLLSLGKNWHKAKDEIIKFVVDLTGEPIEIVKKLKFKQLQEIFTDLFKDEEMQDFIKRVSEEQK